MIRRRQNHDFLLIAQHDHAVLAGELAAHLGNERFARPEPFEQAVLGVRLHDCGWSVHDDAPTINEEGLPLDVFESPRTIALSAWSLSADRAAEKDPYAGLLTSLHVLALSVMAMESASSHRSWRDEDPGSKFAIAKFQHRQLELQETLRQRLGLRTERATATKLPRQSMQRPEDQLQFNFRMLQVMDLLSLGLCCTAPPADVTPELLVEPGGPGRRLAMRRQGNDLVVEPWPFDSANLSLRIPACRLPARQYASEAEFRGVYYDAPADILSARVIPA